jgi:hypothetical protein
LLETTTPSASVTTPYNNTTEAQSNPMTRSSVADHPRSAERVEQPVAVAYALLRQLDFMCLPQDDMSRLRGVRRAAMARKRETGQSFAVHVILICAWCGIARFFDDHSVALPTRTSILFITLAVMQQAFPDSKTDYSPICGNLNIESRSSWC